MKLVYHQEDPGPVPPDIEEDDSDKDYGLGWDRPQNTGAPTEDKKG